MLWQIFLEKYFFASLLNLSNNNPKLSPCYSPAYLLSPENSNKEHANALSFHEEEVRAQAKAAATPPTQPPSGNPVLMSTLILYQITLTIACYPQRKHSHEQLSLFIPVLSVSRGNANSFTIILIRLSATIKRRIRREKIMVQFTKLIREIVCGGKPPAL